MKIRRLTYFDYAKLKRMVSYLCSDGNDRLAKSIMNEAFGVVNAVMPLPFKFKPESFVLIDGTEILGLISVLKTPGNFEKINITKLIFKENMYEIGKHLVDFVINKYGDKGAKSFVVTIDECHDELFDLFINSCKFRQCASETLWKMEKPIPEKTDLKWRYAQNSDAKQISQLYNSELVNIYKPSLIRNYKEFREPFFAGFREYNKTRYILGDEKISGYFSITTADYLNYIMDMTLQSGYDYDYDKIINVMLCEIAQKRKAFFPLIKQKKYVKNSEELEQYLIQKGCVSIQTQQILVKDFYRPIVDTTPNWKVFVLGENQVG